MLKIVWYSETMVVGVISISELLPTLIATLCSPFEQDRMAVCL